MASFCRDAYRSIWGEGENDFVALCEPGETTMVLCEGDGWRCPGGYHEVDHEGRRVGPIYKLSLEKVKGYGLTEVMYEKEIEDEKIDETTLE